MSLGSSGLAGMTDGRVQSLIDVERAWSGYNAITDGGAKGDGSTDDKTALQNGMNAAAAADQIFLLPTPSVRYLIGGELTPPNDLKIVHFGRPEACEIRFTNAFDNSVIFLNGKSNIHIKGVTLDNNYTSGTKSGNPINMIGGCSNITLEDVHLKNPNDHCLYAKDTDFLTLLRVKANDSPNNEGVFLDACDDFFAQDTEANNNGRFGFYMTGKSLRARLTDCKGNGNDLEGMGARWGCNHGILEGGEYNDGASDNGISITADFWTATGFQANRNAIYGAMSWGSHNYIDGVAMDNNQSNSSEPYSGGGVQPAFGGMGRHNVINLVAGDTQSTPTQKYGCFLRGTAYDAWANGFVVDLDTQQVYKVHNNNLYEALTEGTTATGSEPTHTSGTATGADGITWEYIGTTTASEGFNAAWNVVNVAGRGNVTGLYGKSANSVYNTVNGSMWGTTAQLPAVADSVAGMEFFDTTTGALKKFNGTSWVTV